MRIAFITQSAEVPESLAAVLQADSVQSLLAGYASPDTTIDVIRPDEAKLGGDLLETLGKQNMLNGLHHVMETPPIIHKTLWAEQAGYDAVVQSNTFDPGVEGARLAVRIPVIGLLRTAFHVALTTAHRVGVIVPLAPHVPYTRGLLRSYGVLDAVTGIRPIGLYGAAIVEQRGALFTRLVELVRELVDVTEAEVVIPLGGAVVPYVISPTDLQEATGVPVLNVKAIGIQFAEMCVRLGISHSEFAYPKAKLRAEDLA